MYLIMSTLNMPMLLYLYLLETILNYGGMIIVVINANLKVFSSVFVMC